MSDARWLDIEDSVSSAVRHFGNAIAIYSEGLSDDEDLGAYKGRMALLQAMQAGYSSLELALERILETIGEELPSASRNYHAQLVRRVARAVPGERPALVEGELAAALDEARRFRHVARRAYDDFESPRAAPAVDAAKRIVADISGAVAVFKARIEGG